MANRKFKIIEKEKTSMENFHRNSLKVNETKYRPQREA